jgi:bacillithiol biosynthesis deacetylase BshB1
MLTILAIGAHPDDVELGMGATIAKLARLGHNVHIIDLTDGEPTPCGSKEKRKKESIKSAKILGITQRITLNLPNRYLQDTIEAREELAGYIRKIRPEIVFCHFWIDKHPDHEAASKITEAGVFYSKFTATKIPNPPWEVGKMYYFYAIHSRININPSFIIDVSEDFNKKIEALKAYKSQFIDNKKNVFVIDYLKKQGAYFGSLIKRAYGEPFISKENIGINNIIDLVL